MYAPPAFTYVSTYVLTKTIINLRTEVSRQRQRQVHRNHKLITRRERKVARAGGRERCVDSNMVGTKINRTQNKNTWDSSIIVNSRARKY